MDKKQIERLAEKNRKEASEAFKQSLNSPGIIKGNWLNVKVDAGVILHCTDGTEAYERVFRVDRIRIRKESDDKANLEQVKASIIAYFRDAKAEQGMYKHVKFFEVGFIIAVNPPNTIERLESLGVTWDSYSAMTPEQREEIHKKVFDVRMEHTYVEGSPEIFMKLLNEENEQQKLKQERMQKAIAAYVAFIQHFKSSTPLEDGTN